MRIRSFWHFNRLTFFALDCVLLWAAVVCAFKLSPRYEGDILQGPWLNPELRFVGYGMPLFMALGLQLAGLQISQAGFRGSETLTRALVGITGGMAVFLMLHALVEFQLVGRFVLGFSLLYGVAFVLGSRVLLWRLAEHDTRSVMVYGDESARRLLEKEIAHLRLPMRIVGHTTLEGLLPQSDTAFAEIQRINLYAHATKLGADEIVVEVPQMLTTPERQALILCTAMGMKVTDIRHFFEEEFEKVHVNGLDEAWFWGYDPMHSKPVFFAFKRVTDIALSLLGLLAIAPIAPLIALAIWLQDRGPAIYSQVRVGRGNESFRIYKFRTMRVDAEAHGAQWAKVRDDRVTWLGRLLRKTRLDEVPQFWNILRGEMSFVGPRPERPELVEKIEAQVPFYRYRHLVKPGLTGWAQVNYSYGASVEDARQKLAYDFYYLKYASITRELHIVLRTVVAALQGAR
jgi:exopolysaccharide biosynthesis polyprenyl glycosylphosphotransferase